jgi:Centromere DNA-binding protein complex CBF3 subunit, domain 2
MVGCYLNSLPRKFMRIIPGHPLQMGCFGVHWVGVAPPNELLSIIWPQLDA